MFVLCLVFEKNHFHQLSIHGFEMNDTVNFEDIVLHIFSGYQTRIFHSKSAALIVLCLGVKNSLFSTIYSVVYE